MKTWQWILIMIATWPLGFAIGWIVGGWIWPNKKK